jgi:hypothetical protein
MQKRWPLVAAVVVLLATIAALLIGRPWRPPPSFATTNELGYVIEYEFDPDKQHIHQSNPNKDGKTYVGVIVEGHYSVMILNGALTVNREPRGEVRKGDQIKVLLDRRIWVNGVERRP